MTIEIHRPDLEAMIVHRMKSGGFVDVEECLMQALEASPATAKPRDQRTGADLIAALQACPHPEIDITPPRVLLTKVRDVIL